MDPPGCLAAGTCAPEARAGGTACRGVPRRAEQEPAPGHPAGGGAPAARPGPCCWRPTAAPHPPRLPAVRPFPPLSGGGCRGRGRIPGAARPAPPQSAALVSPLLASPLRPRAVASVKPPGRAHPSAAAAPCAPSTRSFSWSYWPARVTVKCCSTGSPILWSVSAWVH